jgi:opacity protein-like surface antigen
LAFSAALAQAADIPDYPSLPLPSREKLLQSVELSSGWYLRGDIGYQFRHAGSSLSGDTTLVPSPASAKLDNAFMAGIGAGYKAHWFRVDLTGDYSWRSKYNATTVSGTTIDGKINAFTVMFNGYLDLGTWFGITPYVGAGIGGADLVFSGYRNPSAAASMPSSAPMSERWNLAWAAMAGLSYNFAPNLLLDVGYRHVDMGDVSGGPNNHLTIKRLTGDEIRVGIRYLID